MSLVTTSLDVIDKFVFVSKERVFCQSKKKILECTIRENNTLEKLEAGFEMKVGCNRFRLVDYIKGESTSEYLLMIQDKVLHKCQEKGLYIVNLKQRSTVLHDDLKPTFILSTTDKQTSVEEGSVDIFSSTTELKVRACYDAGSKKIYAMVCSKALSLLYCTKFPD